MNYSNFDQGDIVIVDMPYSNFLDSKTRPGLVFSPREYNEQRPDVIVLKITAVLRNDEFSIPFTSQDLAEGILRKESKVRADFPYVVEKRMIRQRIGRVKKGYLQKIKMATRNLYQI